MLAKSFAMDGMSLSSLYISQPHAFLLILPDLVLRQMLSVPARGFVIVNLPVFSISSCQVVIAYLLSVILFTLPLYRKSTQKLTKTFLELSAWQFALLGEACPDRLYSNTVRKLTRTDTCWGENGYIDIHISWHGSALDR